MHIDNAIMAWVGKDDLVFLSKRWNMKVIILEHFNQIHWTKIIFFQPIFWRKWSKMIRTLLFFFLFLFLVILISCPPFPFYFNRKCLFISFFALSLQHLPAFTKQHIRYCFSKSSHEPCGKKNCTFITFKGEEIFFYHPKTLFLHLLNISITHWLLWNWTLRLEGLKIHGF